MADTHKAPDPINPLLVAILGVAGALVFGFLLPWWLVQAAPELNWSHYRSEILGASVTIATGLVLSVVVAMLVENHRLRSARRANDRDLRRALVSQLRDVHDQVKAAALLIRAHRSARTYGEQMRRLIEVRVRLLDARRTISAEPRPFGSDVDVLVYEIDSGTDYLNRLTSEYEEQYLRISRIQSYSYEWDQAQARAAAQSKEPPTPEHMRSTTLPWEELTGPAFGRLKALREADDEAAETHRVGFSEPIGRAIDLLRAMNERRM